MKKKAKKGGEDDCLLKQKVTELIEDNAGYLKSKKRDMSPHIVSRWYRPPEIILGHHRYDQSVDIWSLGCILADLLFLVSSDQKQRKEALFLGDSCFPLSPISENEQHCDGPKIESSDQLIQILKVLGHQGHDDTCFLQDSSAQSYFENLQKCVSPQKQKLQSIFPDVSSEMVSLLSDML